MATMDTTTLAELATQRQAQSIFATVLDQDTFINCTYARAHSQRPAQCSLSKLQQQTVV